jgi:hypothetical protein
MTPHTIFTSAQKAEKASTRQLAFAAVVWRSFEWGLEDFVNHAVLEGYNAATAKTQWYRSKGR